MIDSINKDFLFFERALGLRQYRQEILATNIANSDTPNYKARDIDFADSLRSAMGANGLRNKPLPDTSLNLTSARHIPGKAHTPAPANVLYRTPSQPSLDGNTVDMNQERMAFADNTMHYQSELQVINNRIKQMLTALQQ